MNVHFSYKIEKNADLENLLQQQTDKLSRLLQVFRPELVSLKGTISENTAREGFGVALNLRLPTGQMAAQGKSDMLIGAVKTAFGELAEQIKKHKQLLRNQHKWPRRRGPARAVVATTPFEQTVAAVKPEAVQDSDVLSYVNVNLPRLRRFVQRELVHRQNENQLLPGQLLVDDVVDEAVANALGDHHDKPERMRLEPWLYRLSLEAMDHLASAGREGERVALDSGYPTGDARDMDETMAQFGGAEEPVESGGAIADTNSPSPEELAARNELIDLVQRALRDAGREQREAFILYTIEGFTLEEIADISGRSGEEVRASIRRAGTHLQRALPIRDPLKDKLVQYAETA